MSENAEYQLRRFRAVKALTVKQGDLVVTCGDVCIDVERANAARPTPATEPPAGGVTRKAVLTALAVGPLRCRELGDRLGVPNDRQGVLYRELKRLIRQNVVRLHPDDIGNKAKKPRYQLVHPPTLRPDR